MTIFDLINRFDFMRGLPAVYVVLLMAIIIVMAWDWRLSLLALLVQYLTAGLLFIDVLDPRLAVVKLLVGLFVCLILYITARQVNYGRLPIDVTSEEAAGLGLERQVRIGPYLLPTSLPFRFFAAIMIVLAAWALAQRPAFQLPVLSDPLVYLNWAVYGLAGLGLLGMGLTADPWRAGLGMLLFLTGFELFYSALEQSVAVLALLAVVTMLITLFIAYLTQARHALPALVD
ncbi:MAG: hypothetical protein H6667_03880 [Ardenticatenaceae bacterium]|nr:hypothetical protein [Ardenticatenaceae bacterium]